MLKVDLRRSKFDCSILKNKGKTIYADKKQHPLEEIQNIESAETFELVFYTRFRLRSGYSFESVEKVELLDYDYKPKYKVHLEDGETEIVRRKIKKAEF